MFEYFIYHYGTQIIAAILCAIFGCLGYAIKQLAVKYINDDTKRAIARVAVQFVEQVWNTLHGADKLAKALETAEALLKKKGVKHIYARAVDDVHKTVLEAFNLDSILTPEKEAARSLVRLLDLHVNVESFQIDEEHYVMKFKLPSCFVGYKVSDLSLETEFNMKIIALIKGEQVLNGLGISILEHQVENHFEENYELEEEDQLVCYGLYKNFMDFWKAL